MSESTRHFETLTIHGERMAGTHSSGDPVVYPKEGSTIFRMGEDENVGPIYTRHDNPNRQQLETMLALLEGGEACAAFASGMAASSAILQSLRPGDHLLIPLDLYHGVRTLARDLLKPWNLAVDAVDMTDPVKVKKAIRPETKMVWMETPSNPLLQITDIEAITSICRERGILTVVDNTWPSPILQRPIELGTDLVLHSTSKYIGGHSDLLGGAVIARSAEGLFESIRKNQSVSGAVPSPDDCWLMLRSIRTLPWRMRGHDEHAMQVARYLAGHPAVSGVFYPGLEDHPGYKIARRQMDGFGGMLSFLVKGDRAATKRVFLGSKLIIPATSLGGVESLWEHRIRSEGPKSETPENLIRLSVGLEHPDDLIQDISQALKRV
ncbi:MAG: aminotransferase class I/II-fold pyridoxal phosphate-dependent enzyme [Balneolaceae bacterium]